MLIDSALVVGGLVLLSYAADRFVVGAARLATAFKVSAVLVGAIVIGFGTSAPEFVVTILATVRGSQDLAFGNVVGSNTANMLLVLGAAGLVSPLAVQQRTLRREVPLMLLAVGLLTIATYNARVTTPDAVLLLAASVAVVWFIVHVARRDKAAAAALETEVSDFERSGPINVPREAVVTVLGLAGTLAGAQLLVEGATGLAKAFGVTEAVIGLTIVAVGTSLPELVTGMAAARRGEADLVVGNVLGSNIFNSLPVAGVAGLLDTVSLDAAFQPSLAVMVGSCLLAAWFLRTGSRIARAEASLLLLLFAGATTAAVVLT